MGCEEKMKLVFGLLALRQNKYNYFGLCVFIKGVEGLRHWWKSGDLNV